MKRLIPSIGLLALMLVFSWQITIDQASASGTLTFAPYETVASGTFESVRVLDLNADSRADIVAATGSELHVMLQNADGTLATAAVYPLQGGVRSIAVDDMNLDNRPDVVAVSSTHDNVSVLYQNADSTFTPYITLDAGNMPDAIEIGDVIRDGRNDIAVSHWGEANIGVFAQQPHPDHLLSEMFSFASPQAGYDDIDVGDINNDGYADIIKMNGQGMNPNLSVYPQTNNYIGSPVSYDLLDYGLVQYKTNARSIAVGDVTGDGLDDVVMTYGGNRPASKLTVFQQTNTGILTPTATYDVHDIPVAAELRDIDGDGRLDVFMMHSGHLKAGVLLQQSDGTLGAEQLFATPHIQLPYPNAIDAGDVNGDGSVDLVVASDPYGVTVLYQDPPPAMQVAINDYSANMGGSVTVSVVFSDVVGSGVGAATIDVNFDSSALTPTNCVVDAAGNFDGGTCNPAFDDDTVRFNLTSNSGSPLGSYAVADITFDVAASAPLTTALDVQTVVLVDPALASVDYTERDGTMELSPIGDVNCDGTRNALDGSLILQFDSALVSSSNDCPPPAGSIYDALCDANGDNVCNVIDALLVLQCDAGLTNILCPVASRSVAQPLALSRSANASMLNISSATIGNEAGLVDISAEINSDSLQAAAFNISYDPNIVTAIDCAVADGLVGVCNPAYDNDGIAPDSVRFSLASAHGVTEQVALGNITFQPNASSGEVSLDASIDVFGNADGNLAVNSQSGAVSVSAVSAVTLSNAAAAQNGPSLWLVLAGLLLLGVTLIIGLRLRSKAALLVIALLAVWGILSTVERPVAAEVNTDTSVYLPFVSKNYCRGSFQDEFTMNNGNWFVGTFGTIVLGYTTSEEYGTYHFNTDTAVLPLSPVSWDNGVELSADSRIEAGSGAYGLVIGYVNNGQTRYQFEVAPATQVWLLIRVENGVASLAASGQSAAINTSGVNRLAIKSTGANSAELKINGTTLHSFSGGLAGQVGLSSSSFAANTDIRFDNFLYAAQGCEALATTRQAEPLVVEGDLSIWEGLLDN